MRCGAQPATVNKWTACDWVLLILHKPVIPSWNFQPSNLDGLRAEGVGCALKCDFSKFLVVPLFSFPISSVIPHSSGCSLYFSRSYLLQFSTLGLWELKRKILPLYGRCIAPHAIPMAPMVCIIIALKWSQFMAINYLSINSIGWVNCWANHHSRSLTSGSPQIASDSTDRSSTSAEISWRSLGDRSEIAAGDLPYTIHWIHWDYSGDRIQHWAVCPAIHLIVPSTYPLKNILHSELSTGEYPALSIE